MTSLVDDRPDVVTVVDVGVWAKLDRFRLFDALYVELSRTTEAPLLTTDARLGRAYSAAVVIQE